MKIKVTDIIPDPNQPRKTFKEESLKELGNSFNSLGIIQPITVRLHNGKYMIVTGERRYRAAKLDGLSEVECILRDDIDDKKAREMQFAENAEQEDVPPLELGKAFLEHRKKYHLTQEQLSHQIGIAQQTLSQYERLLLTGSKIQSYVQSGDLDAGTAYRISTIKDKERQEELAEFTIDKGLARSAVEKLKPMVEAQQYRPVKEIYRSMQEEDDFEPEPEPYASYFEEAEEPVLLIELKLAAEHLIIAAQNTKIGLLDKLSPNQKQDLVQTLEQCIEAIQEHLAYLKGEEYKLLED